MGDTRESLFRVGDFTLHSGDKAQWKIDCDALTDSDIEALAKMICEQVRPFTRVMGIPRGGMRLAKALEPFCAPPESCAGVLIVDDVLTTGTSMEQARTVRSEALVQGAVIFARGECPEWIVPLFQMSPTANSPKSAVREG